MTKPILLIFLLIIFGIICHFTLTNAIAAGELKAQGLEHSIEMWCFMLGMIAAAFIGWIVYWVEEHE